MGNITKKELKEILKQHKLWLRSDGKECKRADLSSVNLTDADLAGADLRFANLRFAVLTSANLSRANLYEAYLTRANLSRANLSRANLSDADLRLANLYCANLTDADLSSANLTDADLSNANLTDADLTRANLRHTNLSDADLTHANLTNSYLIYANLTYADLTDTILDEKEQCRKGIVLTEPMTGYKKASSGKIITLEMPIGAKIFSINNSKRRTNKAKVIDMQGKTELSSKYDKKFKYHVGDEIDIEDFDERYNVECSTGIHFFLTREEAEEYIY